jgi:N-acyl-D-amino-acid deacylase
MRELVSLGLDVGAFGLSTGLEYDPGSRAGIEELAAIAGPVAAAGGVVTSHLRSEDADRVEAALEELIEQGRRSGARVHVAHIKVVLGRDTALADRLLEAITTARATGVEVSADIYPYTASFTGLSILFPDWARPPADYATVVRQRRQELAGYLRDRVGSRNGPGATLFGTGPFAGRTLAEVATDRGAPFEEVLIDLGPGGGSAAYFVMDDAVMRRLLLDPRVVISSDGSPSMLHPRGHGSFAAVVRRFVVEERALSLEEAVHRMSGATAAIYRLDDPSVSDPPRGRIREGWAADLVAFSPDDVRDTADFEHPHRLATGFRAVWVNGRRAWSADGPVPDAGAGTALRARR